MTHVSGMDSRGVCYFNLNTKCLVRLLVSLHSLRKHYSGSVTILNGGGDEGICDRIGRACGADVLSIPIVQRRKHTAYTTKAGLWKFSPYETTLLIDSDTVVAGKVEPLLELGEKSPGIVVTRFADWISTGRCMSGRISKWRGVKCDGIDVEQLIDDSLDAPHAAINTGVVCWDKTYGREFLQDWDRLTVAGWLCPFGDELAAQILLRKHRHTLVDDRFNCSPLYGTNKSKAVIWHFHGHKERRPEALPYWNPPFQDVWRNNIAGVREWISAEDRAAIEADGLI